MKISIRLNAIFKIILSICNILIPLFVGPYIIRMLSRSSYDIYTKASVEIQLFLALASSAIYTYGIRSVSKVREDKSEVKKVFTELFLISVLFNLFFSIMYLFYINYINNHQGEIIYYILLLQFLGSTFAVEWMNEAHENYRFITIKSLFVKVLYIVTVFFLIKGDNMALYGLIVSLTYVLESLISFLYIYRKNRLKIRKLNFKRHAKSILLAFLITNISLLYVQTDKIMLALLVSDAAVTAYTISNYIVTSIYNVVISIFVVAIPRLTNLLHEKKLKEYRILYNEIMQAFLMIFIPILFYVFLFSEEIIVLYAAGKYNDSIIPLKLFVIVIFFNALVFIQREGVLYLSEKERPIIICNLIGGVFNLIANLILYFLNSFNPVNAIVTLIVSYLIVTCLLRFYIKSKVSKEIKLVNKTILSYFLFSLSIIFIKKILSYFALNTLVLLVVALIMFIITYLLLLVLFKDQIFLNNFKTSIKKVKEYLDKKKRISQN
ncbi:MAG: oligosaccharide flippase family protein [Bacilli bacterium]|nr:oligosaccharide flippase family protein [Bacilli bacterium]